MSAEVQPLARISEAFASARPNGRQLLGGRRLVHGRSVGGGLDGLRLGFGGHRSKIGRAS